MISQPPRHNFPVEAQVHTYRRDTARTKARRSRDWYTQHYSGAVYLEKMRQLFARVAK
jgi:hypothetical protein